MRSLSPAYLSRLRFDAQQVATLRMLGEYQGKQQLYVVQAPEVLSGLQQVAVVESTESSNRLEGVVVAPSRLKSLVLKNAAPKSRSEQEVAGYRDALALIHESASQMPFSENTLLQLHGLLYRYMPQPGGRWKATNNDIVERHADGRSRVRFSPVAAHLTPMAMQELVANYRSALDQHLADPLVLVPLVVLDFLCIHPFSDGNGRIARLLTLQLLYTSTTPSAASSAWSAFSKNPSKAITRPWRPVRRVGTKARTTSRRGSTTFGVRCCAPTRSSSSAWARSGAAVVRRANACVRRCFNARCHSRFRRSSKPVPASAATWCGWC